MPQVNDQIGPYILIRQLGRGAFGVVWLAERRSILATTQVALKLVLDDEADLDAIAQESQLWAQVAGHPNVLSIIEANVYDNHITIVSEYAADGSLQEWLGRNGKVAPSLEEAVSMIAGILAGLEHLHSKKIIHRDLKPANILLQKDVPRLADFGLARVLKSTANSNSIAGTPAYMAPESFDGKRSERSDLWSVGVILYQMLAGRLPFPQNDMTALIGAIVKNNPEPLPPNTPLPFRELIAQALQKDPRKRFNSAAEMHMALYQAAAAAIPKFNSATTANLLAKNALLASTMALDDPLDLVKTTIRKPENNTTKVVSKQTNDKDPLPRTYIQNAATVNSFPKSYAIVGVSLGLIIIILGLGSYFRGGQTKVSDTATKLATLPTPPTPQISSNATKSGVPALPPLADITDTKVKTEDLSISVKDRPSEIASTPVPSTSKLTPNENSTIEVSINGKPSTMQITKNTGVKDTGHSGDSNLSYAGVWEEVDGSCQGTKIQLSGSVGGNIMGVKGVGGQCADFSVRDITQYSNVLQYKIVFAQKVFEVRITFDSTKQSATKEFREMRPGPGILMRKEEGSCHWRKIS